MMQSENNFTARGRGKRRWAQTPYPRPRQQQRLIQLQPERNSFYFPSRYESNYTFKEPRPVNNKPIPPTPFRAPRGGGRHSSLSPKPQRHRSSDSVSKPPSESDSDQGNQKQENVEDRIKLPEFDVSKDNSSFYMQSVRFYYEVHLTKKDQEIRKMVEEDVYLVFERVLPGLKVWTFGSVYTGLANKTSDMDIFLESSTLPSRDFVKRNGHLIRRSPKFKNVFVIDQARVPIIKATHVATGIEMDINATSRQSLLTSALIKFLMSGNSRAKRLTMLVNYWAKLNGLIGSNKFTSFLFCLLTVFYLQQLDPPILPPVSLLMESGDWANEHPYWVRLDPRLLDSSSMIESHDMFEGFFKYYSNFDFKNNIVSCYLGKPIPVSDLQNPQRLPYEMSGLLAYVNETEEFPVGEINIQDLCELHINKTHALQPRQVTAFKMSVTRVVETLSSLPDSEWLRAILSQPPVKIPKNLKKKRVTKSFEVAYPFVDDNDWFVTFRRDLEFVFKLLLITWDDVSTQTHGLTLTVHCEYSVFGKKFKQIVPSLLTGELTVEDFPARVKIVVDRIARPDTRLLAELTVAVAEKGRVQLTFVDLSEFTCTSMFSSYVMSLQSDLEKLLAICHLKWQTS